MKLLVNYIWIWGAIFLQNCLADTPQPNVLSDGKKHGLFLWIHLKPGVNVAEAARKISRLQDYVEEIRCESGTCEKRDKKMEKSGKEDDEDSELLAGVGFGQEFYRQAFPDSRLRNFTYASRSGFLGDMPYTGGDLFVHAKSDSFSKLFQLAQMLQTKLHNDDIENFGDTYGFTYKNGRDLSGFLDGTENPIISSRIAVAVDPETNGSFCITQHWIHNMAFIASQTAPELESFVGRKLVDSAELHNKSITSHVARMTSGADFKAKKPVEIYRQSMPFGTLGESAGLFFIGFAASTGSFDYMLSRMTGDNGNSSDDIMRISRCVSGNFWYFPPQEQLDRLRNVVASVSVPLRIERQRQASGLPKSPQFASSSSSTHALLGTVIFVAATFATYTNLI